MNITIIEDQEFSRYIMKEMISNIYQEVTINEYGSGTEFLKDFSKNRSDIYFIDIELGEEEHNGYELAKMIRENDKSAIIIFLSGHTEYACEAFEVGALRFLTKPLKEEKLREAMNKALLVLKQGRQPSVVIHQKNMQIKILAKDILYIESILRKVYVKMLDGMEYTCYETMNEMEQTLDSKMFVRVHRSYIVSMYYIDMVTAEAVILNNGKRITIGRKYKEMFRKRYAEYIKGKIGI